MNPTTDADTIVDIDHDNDVSNDTNDSKWWNHIPKGAEAIVKGIAAEYVVVDLLNDRLRQPRKVGYGMCHLNTNTNNTNNNKTVDFVAVHRLLREYPALAHGVYEFHWDYYSYPASSTATSNHSPNQRDVRQLTILAMLCCLRPPLDLLRHVYQANPAAICQAEPTKGCLPFHYACTFDAPLEVLEFLLQAYPQALQRPRHDGMTPLHLSSYFKAPLSIVRFLTHQQQQQQQQQQQGSANAIFSAAAAAQAQGGGKGADNYAEQGILGPWSERAAGLLGSMVCADGTGGKGKRSRKKQPKDKPKRPLSAYNIFFKEERARLLEKTKTQTEEQKKGMMTANGKIGFQSLAKIIGGKWQEMKPEDVEYYKKKAATDMERYKKEMEAFKAKIKRAEEGEEEPEAPQEADDNSNDEEGSSAKKQKVL